MNDRVNACLDGELEEAALNAVERAEVARIRGAAATLRAAVPPAAADLDVAVLRRIRELGLEPAPAAVPVPDTPARRPATAPASGIAAVFRLLWQPRQVAFRPVWAAGFAVVLLLLLVARPDAPVAPVAPGGSAGVDAVAAAPPVFVQFRLDAEGASNVALAGSFSEWTPAHPLVETQPGVWTVVVALEPGVHDYAFLVDGERWVVDPAAPFVEDGFGGHNSRLALLPAL